MSLSQDTEKSRNNIKTTQLVTAEWDANLEKPGISLYVFDH